MKQKLRCILLIDDNPDDNFYHKIIINQMGITERIEEVENGLQALEFLKKENQIIPELIFLDVNMPKMNGWEFLEEYKNLDPKQKARITIVMLTTSGNPADIKKAEQIEEVTDYKTKPLTVEMMTELMETYFSDYL